MLYTSEMEKKTSPESPPPKWYQLYGCERPRLNGVPFLLAYIVSLAALHQLNDLPGWARFLIVLFPLPFFGWFVVRFTSMLRAADELQRRIELEALAIALPLSVALLMTLALLHSARIIAGADDRYLFAHLIILYGVGRAIAWRRYR
jgi:hypothetical protein